MERKVISHLVGYQKWVPSFDESIILILNNMVVCAEIYNVILTFYWFTISFDLRYVYFHHIQEKLNISVSMISHLHHVKQHTLNTCIVTA